MDNKVTYYGHMSAYKFGSFIGNFDLETMATSEAEAKKNFTYQVKSRLGLLPNSKIDLEGKIWH